MFNLFYAFSSLIAAFVAFGTAQGQSESSSLRLRLMPRADAFDLAVDGTSSNGAFVVYQAADLSTLRSNPTVVMAMSTSVTNGMIFSLPVPSAALGPTFFTAAYWPGQTVGEVLSGDPDMLFISAGSFEMGDTFNDSIDSWAERPVHTVHVAGFCIGKYKVTKALWDEVYSWAILHGYSFERSGRGKALDHPVSSLTWYDAVKWCNARSEKEGRVPAYYTSAALTDVYRTGQVSLQNDWVKWSGGYRLPTEAEWEKAARGNVKGQRFPWGNTISHSQANYFSATGQDYDVSPTIGWHPTYSASGSPFTNPVGAFAPNGYGLYGMAGNVYEWCWDWWSDTYYSSSPSADPRGPADGSNRVLRGGASFTYAFYCRSALRYSDAPNSVIFSSGFRVVLVP